METAVRKNSPFPQGPGSALGSGQPQVYDGSQPQGKCEGLGECGRYDRNTVWHGVARSYDRNTVWHGVLTHWTPMHRTPMYWAIHNITFRKTTFMSDKINMFRGTVIVIHCVCRLC